MSPKVKSLLIIAAKQGVNAALVAVTPVIQTPGKYNLTTWLGIEHVLILMAGAIAARELMVWVPKLMAWSQSGNQ